MSDRVNQREMEELYTAQLKSGKCWEDIIREVASDSKERAQQLVDYRDALDYRLYREIMESLFPRDFFEVVGERGGKIEQQQDGHFKYVQNWYVFKIYDSGLTGPAKHDENCCIVKINAPGSRNLTSDIDTTVTVTRAEKLKEGNFPYWLRGQGPDYNGRIVNRIIKEFNERRLKIYRVTSATALDSNVYAEGFLGEHVRFSWPEVKKSLGIPATEILPFEREENFFAEFRIAKHIQEQAASLFLLHEALPTPEDWRTFTTKVTSAVREEFPDDSQSKPILKEFDDAVVRLAEIYNGYTGDKVAIPGRVAKLETKKKELRAKGIAEVELEIAAMNELYFEYLEEVTKCNGDIMQLPSKIKGLLVRIQEKESNRLKEERKLAKYQGDADFVEEEKRQRAVCSECTKEVEETKDQLRKTLLHWAKLQNHKQYLQIMANTFAIEAYSNWGAPYHVVRGIQEKQPIILSKQAIMGSCLQQVGFRLIHSKLLRQKQVPKAKIALKVAKYGQRIADLIFGQNGAGSYVVVSNVYADTELQTLTRNRRGNFLNILARFNSAILASGGHAYFTGPEYSFLNSEIAIVEVKGNTTLTEKAKLEKIAAILAAKPFKPEEEQELLLSIASKLIAATYTAKLNKPRSVASSTAGMAAPAASGTPLTLPSQSPSARQPMTPMADSQRSRFNASGAVAREGGIRQIDMGQGPVDMDASHAQTRDPIEQMHTAGATSEQIDAAGRLLGHPTSSPK